MSKLFSLLSVLLMSVSAFGAGAVGKMQGAAVAVEATDERMTIAAGKIGWSLAKAKEAAAKDRDLHVSADNRLFYACKFVAPVGSLPGAASAIQTGPDTTTYTGTPPTVTATSAFQLHSRPGASRVLYLDFNGHSTLSWGTPAIVSPAFQLSGTTSPTDQLNLNAIRDIWLHVAEDFAAWDIDVTTEQPPTTARGQRCVIGGSTMDWLGVSGVMGIAQLNSFGGFINGNDTVNFVFIDNNYPSMKPTTSNYEVTILCVAHEVGHTLGLQHWGETASGSGQAYTVGHTVTGHTGVTSVCPIMGNSGLVGWPSSCNLNQWSKGDYPFSNIVQDDIVTITTFAPKVTDDHGDTLATATVVSGTSITGGGIISDTADVDLMKITVGAGPLTLALKPHLKYRNYGGNLKVGISLLNSAGTVVAKNYDVSSLGNSLTYNVPTGGTYYIKVNGMGYDPSKSAAAQVWTNTGITGTVVGTTAGFTNYGSLGRYGIVGTWQSLIQLPTAIITSDRTGGVRPVVVAFDGRTSSDPDGVIAGYSWNFGDAASGSANMSTLGNPVHTYSSPGTFTASLVVTDNQGNASAAATKVITVSGAALPNSVRVASMTGSWARMTNVEVAGTAVIQVVNQYGQPLRSVAVYVRVTGSATGSAAAKTDLNGYVTIQMPKQRMTNPSTYTFSVTSLVYPAYTYNMLANLPSPASVTITR
ncbi:MAG: PKD domain-containing protein [Verrucomicrobia bacterium]|nr:PKD domain-containing protein [Verrucomicrobiota bacterium]